MNWILRTAGSRMSVAAAMAALAVMCVGLPVVAGTTAGALAASSIPSGYGKGPGFCKNVVSSGYDLGNGSTSYDDIYPCGPEPGKSFPSYGDGFQPSGGFQCTELANRFLFNAWGLQPVFGSSLDGKTYAQTVHTDYPSVQLIANGTAGQPYLPGDIVSFTGNSNEPDGHVAVVIASTENPSGNGTVTIMEQNAALSGQESLKVSGWKLLPAAGSYVTPYDFDALASSIPLSASPVIGVVTSNGKVLAKEGSLSASWTDEYNGASSVAVASDPTYGPLIAVLTSSGKVLAKEGSLSASWTDEYNGASSVAVASDPTHGPLIAVLTSSGKVLAKEGSLSASWTDEYNGASSVAVASDPTHGPLIAVLTSSGKVLAKEGSLSASWTDEYNGVVRVAVASDPTNGPLIATYANNGEALAKEGSLSASWTDEYKLLPFVAVASDPTRGPLIAVWSGNGEVLAKEGSLSASWTDEYNGVVRVAVAG
jgi:CHAP domain